MADIIKKISELNPITAITSLTAIVAITEGLSTYKVTIDNLLKNIKLVSFKESEYNNGSIASGTFTPDCDANGNSHLITLTGAGVTIEVPTKTLTGDDLIEGSINIKGGDVNAIAGWGVNWTFGTAGEPTLTADSEIGFKRTAGDTKTKAWHNGGFA